MPDLTEATACLTAAIEACQGRVAPELLGRAQAIVGQVDRRLSLSRQSTVVALVGATGSGKSSVFNALTRTALAAPGVQRPTTQQTMAVTFGDEDTSGLLDWLGVGQRHIVAPQDLDGVVLLDLADFDSVVTEHRDEVNRVLEVADELLWVVDPQKYADAMLHENYLRHFADHTDVMVFILNQIDRLSDAQTSQIHGDFIRLLQADGQFNPLVYDVSALTGQGIDVLRRHVGHIASTKHAMVARLEADILVQAKALRAYVGHTDAGSLGKTQITAVTEACLQAADVDQIRDAVYHSAQRRGRIATGWPALSWLGRLKLDPLRRLRLDPSGPRRSQDDNVPVPVRQSSARRAEPALTRSSLVVRPIAQARVDTAVRAVGHDATSRLPRGWNTAMDRLLRTQSAALPDAIDQAVVSTDLGVKTHLWWNVVRVFQWVILAVAAVGLVWLAVNFIFTGFLGLRSLPTPTVGVVPLPTLLLVGGIILGLILAGISRIAVNLGAKTTAAGAVRRLRRAMEATASTTIITPVNDELHRHDLAKAALDRIIG